MSYLGLSLGARFKSIHIWNSIVERVERRLAGWKHMYLSKGGCLTLIKFILSNLPTYFLSMFPTSVSVAKRLERIQSNFLWGWLGEERKLQLVNWDTVCSPQIEESCKWLWQFGVQRESFWREIIEAKYGVMEGDGAQTRIMVLMG